MASLPVFQLSESDYLRLERAATEKSEYHDGEMFAMSGGSPNHALLIAEISVLLHRQMPKGCRVFSADLRIKVSTKPTYLYADCSIICGEPQLTGDATELDNALNPTLIVEVLSPSSENYDRGKKFEFYRAIETFREYLILHQDRRHIEYHAKQDDGSWLLREYKGADAVVPIARWNMAIPLGELYANAMNLDETD